MPCSLPAINSKMLKLLTIIFLTFLFGCNLDNKNKTSTDNSIIPIKKITDTTDNEYTLTCRFNSFDTTVDVIFNNTVGAINNCQKKNYEGFISKQDYLIPEILQQVFEYYKKSYPDYYRGWSYGNQLTKQQIEENLPIPTNATNLKYFIKPLSVYIADKKNCEEGTFGVYFDCTWDIKSSLGVIIKKWNVAEVGTGDIAFLF